MSYQTQLSILARRIADLLNCKNPLLQFGIDTINNVPLFQLYAKEDYQRIKQMLWDEYQHRIEPIDSLKETAYILQTKIKA